MLVGNRGANTVDARRLMGEAHKILFPSEGIMHHSLNAFPIGVSANFSFNY